MIPTLKNTRQSRFTPSINRFLIIIGTITIVAAIILAGLKLLSGNSFQLEYCY